MSRDEKRLRDEMKDLEEDNEDIPVGIAGLK